MVNECLRKHFALEITAPQLCAQNHCSSLLRRHFAFKITAPACAPAQLGLTHLTFGGTALLRPVLCTTPQVRKAPYANLVYIYIYIYIYVGIYIYM